MAPGMEMDRARIHGLQRKYGGDLSRCYTCTTCTGQCPVGRYTGRLSPLRLLRTAALGLWDELVAAREVWYCLECGICAEVCPMGASPVSLIRDARREAVFRGVVPLGAWRAYRRLRRRFPRVRWRLAQHCLEGREVALTPELWRRWLEEPVPAPPGPIALPGGRGVSPELEPLLARAWCRRCLACNQCEGACPVAGERAVFDPKGFARLVLMGRAEEVLAAPGLWLCLQCGRCTAACSQGVDGRGFLAGLQERAQQEGPLPAEFFLHWDRLERWAYGLYLEEVDRCLAPSATRREPAAAEASWPAAMASSH